MSTLLFHRKCLNARVATVCFILTIFLPACAASLPETPTPTQALTYDLTPYHSPTAEARTPLPSPTSSPLPPPTLTPRPSPTPIIYQIKKNDTLLGIAGKFGVKVDDLLAANPGLDPQFLTIGAQITIPKPALEGEQVGGLEITPVPLEYSAPTCYPAGDGSSWCFLWILNSYEVPLVNLQAQFWLKAGGKEFTQTAYSALVRVMPGQSGLLATRFNVEVPPYMVPQVRILSALRGSENAACCLPLNLVESALETQANGASARVTGIMRLPKRFDQMANQVSLVAVGLDSSGQVVGFKRWEKTTPLEPGAQVDFNVIIYSLGPPITQVEIFGEAYP